MVRVADPPVALEDGLAVLQDVRGEDVVEHAGADHGVVPVDAHALGDLLVRDDPADAGAGGGVRLAHGVRDDGLLVHVCHGPVVLRVVHGHVHLVRKDVRADGPRDVRDLLQRVLVEHAAHGVGRVVDADELRVGLDEALQLLDVRLPAKTLLELPVVDLRPQLARHLVQRRVRGPLSDDMVAGLDEDVHRVQVRAGAPVRLEDPAWAHGLAIELRHLVLELRGALDPAVVHDLAVQALVERGALLAVEGHQLVHRERSKGRLRDVPLGALLVYVQPVLAADELDGIVHEFLLMNKGEKPYSPSPLAGLMPYA